VSDLDKFLTAMRELAICSAIVIMALAFKSCTDKIANAGVNAVCDCTENETTIEKSLEIQDGD